MGVSYSWEEDEQGPKVVVTMNDPIKEIIDMTEKHIGTAICPRKTPAPDGFTLEEGLGEERMEPSLGPSLEKQCL